MLKKPQRSGATLLAVGAFASLTMLFLGRAAHPSGADLPRWAERAPACLQPIDHGALDRQLASRRHSLPLNNPPLVPAAEATGMHPDDIVVGVLVRGVAVAYPWWMLRSYHNVNDFIAGTPIYVSFCEACSSAAAFSATVAGFALAFEYLDDREARFEVFDYQTHSSWHPFAGIADDGPLKGARLDRLPAYLERWSEWLLAQPQTFVALSSDEVKRRRHGAVASMGDSLLSPWFRKTVRTNDDRLPENELLFGLVPRRARARAYPLEWIKKRGDLVLDAWEGRPIALLHAGSYRISAYLRELDGVVLALEVVSRAPLILRDQTGTTWDEWGTALSGRFAGRTLPTVDGYFTKWLQWVNTFPDTTLVGPP
jgi:Protein of unknown function (DUF3179)